MKAAYKQGRPFIQLQDAHLNIAYSCISYLNTSFFLLSQNSNEEERRFSVLQGLHGLQLYSNKYWHLHIVAYMDLVVTQGLKVPDHLLRQLDEVLKYSKVKATDLPQESNGTRALKTKDFTDRLASLNRFNVLRAMLSGLESFQNDLKQQDWTRKSVEGKLIPHIPPI